MKTLPATFAPDKLTPLKLVLLWSVYPMSRDAPTCSAVAFRSPSKLERTGAFTLACIAILLVVALAIAFLSRGA